MKSIPVEMVAAPGEGRRNYAQALDSPCATCTSAACCRYLPLHTFQITNLVELDHAFYVLNFDYIRLGLSATGEWSIYYAYPCRYLDRQDFSCTVHDKPEHPHICRHYNPYNCWYKRAFTSGLSEEFILVDRRRLNYIAEQIEFDEGRNLVKTPDWPSMMADLAAMPVEEVLDPEPPAADPVLLAWQELVTTGQAQAAAPPTRSYQEMRDPCSNCDAYCCTTLVFPHGMPTTIANLDYYQFCLGFPGVELGISDEGWALVIRTTCRHLEAGRCAVFGQPERPLICRYYDELKCTYRVNFGHPRPPAFLRMRLEEYQQILPSFEFDDQGAIVQIAPLEAMRRQVESGWRNGVNGD
ncbi:MAG: hypothetical protein R3300_10535 [Candidatus Promineifilaceae bacterium]|nr:hypothetical protein [Candidatus Promineifilaceae bacterium]